MSLLDGLWDDTVAGPRPEKGLGKLRKQTTFARRASSSGKESDGGSAKDGVSRVTRSIMIVRPPGNSAQNDSPPISPAGSTPPVSPFSGGRETNRFRRRSVPEVSGKAGGFGPRSDAPPPYSV